MAGAADGPRGATGGREGEAATRPAPVLNTMSAKAGDDGPGDTVTVHGAHMGNMDEGGPCDLKGDGWSTGLCEFMNPDATSLFDWGYVCTSCACPCLQFYLNWLIILKGAPEERFYCLSGPCCTCGDPVHAACETLCCVVGYPFISCKVRGMIRKKTKVEGSVWKDCLLSCCCNALSLAQEARHLAGKPYKGGDTIPLPTWRKCLIPCFPVRKRDERLLTSAREGELEKCRALLIGGANINVRDGNENTPLMGAATYGRLETVDFLIKAKADLNATDRIGATPLMKAAQKGHFETVFLLWDSGAQVKTKDSYGKSAYDYAIGETKDTLKAILRIKDEQRSVLDEMLAKDRA